ncbi:MAG: hypothetical protein ACLFQX_04035 [Candidatus Kapaibacterium sp.]
MNEIDKNMELLDQLGNKHICEEEYYCICEDCGETDKLVWGVCLVCGGNVIEKEGGSND